MATPTYTTIDATIVRRALVLNDNVEPAEREWAINEVQKQLTRRCCPRWLGASDTITIAALGDTGDLPTDWARPAYLYLVINGVTKELEQKNLAELRVLCPPGTSADVPKYYALWGEKVVLGPPWKDGGTLYADYYAEADWLDTSNPQNAFTRHAWDILTLGGVVNALEYQFDDENVQRLQHYKGKFDAEVLRLMREADRAESHGRRAEQRGPR